MATRFQRNVNSGAGHVVPACLSLAQSHDLGMWPAGLLGHACGKKPIVVNNQTRNTGVGSR